LLVATEDALRGSLRRIGVALGVIGALLGCGAVGVPAAVAGSAHIYWSNDYSTTIGRSSPEGTGVEDELIKGASAPEGLAVAGQYVFWANEGGTSIGRASLEGSEVDQEFITGADQPTGLASYGGRLYWANLAEDTIGEANLGGGEVDQEFIKQASEPGGVAAGGQYIYWSNLKTGTIGRANLSGGEVDQEFIKVAGKPDGLAVAGSSIYWSNFATGTIGRANISGGEVDQEFIKGGLGPDGVAVDAHSIYWTNLQGDTIGRASLEGTEVDQEFIHGAVGPGGLALAPAPPVALAAPSSGGVYSVGESVPTAFLCSEGALEPGLASCDDSNAIGTSTGGSGHLNTSTLGPHSYSVTAASTDGQSGLASINYTVAAPPSASIAAPTSGHVYTQGELVTAKFACTEGAYGSGLASCDDSNATATAGGGSGHLSTTALGAHTYTVSAVSKDGQSMSTAIAYTVVRPPKATVQTSRAAVAAATVKLRLSCFGPQPSIACSGTLSLTIQAKRLVRKRVHGHLRTVTVSTTVVLAHKSYTVAHGKQRTVVLQLDEAGLQMLEHAAGRVLHVRASVTVTAGQGTSRSISLER
jgi:virginiamycin B lyase